MKRLTFAHDTREVGIRTRRSTSMGLQRASSGRALDGNPTTKGVEPTVGA